MHETECIDWRATGLAPREREDLLTALTPEQNQHLLEYDYVWIEGTGVLWKPPSGALRRARFTHGAHFRTGRGEFYIDSEGGVRELSRSHRFDRAVSAARWRESDSRRGSMTGSPPSGEVERGVRREGR